MPCGNRSGKGSGNFCVICDQKYLLMMIKMSEFFTESIRSKAFKLL